MSKTWVIFGLFVLSMVVSTHFRLLFTLNGDDIMTQEFVDKKLLQIQSDKTTDEPSITSLGVNDDGEILPIGRQYSAKACHLNPPWGIPMTAQNSCVGKAVSMPYTTADHLTCDVDDKPSKIPRFNGLTVALLHFANPSMLLRQLQSFASYPLEVQKQLTILIVDDGSPPGLGSLEYVTSGMYNFRLRMARIITDKAWNIGGARNLAFHIADTTKVFLLDLDMLVPIETMQALLTWEVRNETHVMAHRFNRRKPSGKTSKHPTVALIDTAAYWESGGCDEDFCGRYGFTDVHFWKRWKADGRRLLLDRMKYFINEVDQIPCDNAYISNPAALKNCTNALKMLKLPSKNREPNRKLLQKKSSDGCWSNRYLRFQWVLQL